VLRITAELPTSSEQVHQDGLSGLEARAITSASGLRLPCGDSSSSGVLMPSQHTKWWLPARQPCNAHHQWHGSAAPSASHLTPHVL
jgi:hypothetical protein